MTPNKTLYCKRSGLPLATISVLCSNGWPLLSHSTFESLVHPVYNFPLEKLLVRFSQQLSAAEQAEWSLIDHDLTEFRLSISAIMYSLDAMWQPSADAAYKQEPSLPCLATAVASGSRLLTIANWYHYATSKRMEFPTYKVSKANNNLGWENFRSWLDAADEVRDEWEEGRTEAERAETLKARTAALASVSAASVYKRIDFAKVWNWIDIQLVQDGRYAAGRRETFKTIFMKGDTSPEDWTVDDIEDIQLAIVEACDVGNDINFFINNRLNQIKAVIQEFYSSFTLLTTGSDSDPADMTLLEKEKSTEFFAAFDQRASNLTELPAAPKRESFATLALFLRAQAQHRILSKRYDMKGKL